MDSDKSSTWDAVFKEEIVKISFRRAVEEPVDEPGEKKVEENLVGLALSGGGIRSATFGLGVLEGLKQSGLLKKIDYLSTVSGGGYIGAWLSANCKRAAERKALPAKAPEDLAGAAAYREASKNWLDEKTEWNESIKHLRRYSNYLSPHVGFFSADTWSMATVWLRNTLLVQLTVILAIAVVLLLPRLLFALFQKWPDTGDWRWTTVVLFVMAVAGIAGNQLRLSRDGNVPFLLRSEKWHAGLAAAVICLVMAVALDFVCKFEPFTDGQVVWVAAAPIALLLVMAGFFVLPVGMKLVNACWCGKTPQPEQVNYTQGWVQALIVLPMLATGILFAAILWGQTVDVYPKSEELSKLNSYGDFFKTAWHYWPFPLSVAFASLWLFSFCSIRSWRDTKGLLAALIAPIPAVLVLHALLCFIMLMMHEWAKQPVEGVWLAFVWAPAMVLYAFSLSIVMLIGIMGRQLTEAVREWWSRLGAWLGIYGFAWMLIAVAAVYGPQWAAIIMDSDTWNFPVIGSWLATTLAGLLAGKSGSTGGGSKNGKSEKTTFNKIMELVATIGPFVFIAGLLIGISTCLHLIILSISGQIWPDMYVLHNYYWEYMNASQVSVVWVWAVLGAAVAGLLLLAFRVDINEFSLNAFYRSRLVRCYLGATRYLPGERRPQNFTGFDEKDELHMDDLGSKEDRPSAGPLHIVNCALNLGGSSDLALHTRHSASFSITPYATGSTYQSSEQSGVRTLIGYRNTAKYGGTDGQPTLGEAISVSGAAASPNMGYHTSPVVAFVLTMFNARLGRWFPNPRSKADSPSPWFSLRYLVKELFGGADDKSKFLMISDGGHFENLAAYELIKRQCRVIIISDAECDPELKFEGLGSLIRMCEVDFGITIKIKLDSIRPNTESNWSSNRCAVGEIDYGKYGNKKIPRGILIYMKASMTGHEDSAVLQYKDCHPIFPHESTDDQFYGEDQFESYRQLGKDIALRTFEPVRGEKWDVVTSAEKLWYMHAPTLDSVKRFTEHTSQLMQLWTQLGSNPKLQVLDKKLEEILAAHWPDQSSSESFRPAFYICSQMIQLMENVYIDLDLENTWIHPDNDGWRNTFENWSKSSAFKQTWSMSCHTYGRRFQYFCNRYLELPIAG